ncbi:MAG: RimK family alpha-L-glutamate ligase [Candidatus Diapherotrites archaeon]|nr:RimK family alpha-L-glutamate ligase [Candidatus Diapherotrites archaeon]
MLIWIIGASKSWENREIMTEALRRGHEVRFRYFNRFLIDFSDKPYVYYSGKKYKLPDVALVRGVGRWKNLAYIITQHLKNKHIPVFEKPEVYKLDNKAVHTFVLLQHKIPTPRTIYGFGAELADHTVELTSYPAVIKPVIGAKGRGVVKTENEVELREFVPKEEEIYVQTFIQNPGRDMRLFIVDNQVIGSMYRFVPEGDFRSNIALGGKGKACEAPLEAEELAIKAVKALDFQVAGVDLLESPNGFMVVEVNRAPQFRDFSKTTGINPAEAIVNFLERNAKK